MTEFKTVPVEPTDLMIEAGWQSQVLTHEGKPVWKCSVDVQARYTYHAMLAAAPASPLPGGGWPVHIVRANGATVDEQRRAVLKSETYKHGDMVLVWVSEGDLYGNPFVELEQLPAAPTGE